MIKIKNLNIRNELKKIWHDDEKMINFCLKDDYFLNMNDFFISFKHKPKIEKTIYYDDERETPKITKDNFINYNLRHNFNNQLDFNFKDNLYCLIDNYKQTNKIKILKELKPYERTQLVYKDDKVFFNNNEINLLNDDDIKKIETLLKTLKDDYLKRLNNYWNRYSNKINTYGYYANR